MGHSILEQTSVERRAGVEYTLRPFASGDEQGFLALYETVFGDRCDSAWFDWRFRQNPHVDDVPMIVVEAEEELVGTRPFFVQEMRVGGELVLALQGVDTMVHPDHRRRGLFSWMTAAANRSFVDREPVFAFAQPNAVARAGYRALGWREVGPTVTSYRLQDPTSLLEARHGDLIGGVAGALLGPTIEELFGSARRPAADETLEIVDVEEVAAGTLAGLYQRDIPATIHANRTASYYRWRFASPAWDRTTSIALRDGVPVAGVLSRTRQTAAGITVTQLADVVPLIGDREWTNALASLLAHVLEVHREVDLVACPDRLVPSRQLSRAGFLRDDRLPLSRFTTADVVLLARPLTSGTGWSIDGISLVDPANWHLSFGERDTI